ncbi:MAG: T9SS type A sorting domain-containing protein [Chitinophagales bacterium]
MPRKYCIFFFAFCAFGISYSQTPVSGVINTYAEVSAINICQNTITLASAAGFTIGDEVLLIQMKGAEINQTNSASFGNMINYHNAGRYEFGIISSISGTVVTLQNTLLHTYDVSGKVQLVRVPVYDDVHIVDTLRAAAWNGATGGILVFDANHVFMDADIQVSYLGFRGGHARNYPSSCPTGLGTSLYYSDTLSGKGGTKGEGIVVLADAYLACRGKAYNGGGGGNDHNAGAGGGAMGGSGGIGGINDEAVFSCPGSAGLASLAPDNTTAFDRIFLGGGGGAGHGNNTNGTSGGDGGGIVIIRANTISGNGHYIRSNGESVTGLAWGDGAGGGGAGGNILLQLSNATDLHIEAKGGKGGDAGANQCTGPGGGGSGGIIKYNAGVLWPGITYDLSGGINGTITTVTSPCYGLTNGASPGANGTTYSGNILAESTTMYTNDFANAGADAGVCPGASVTLNGSGGVSYLWTPSTYLDDATSATPLCTPAADITYILTVTNVNGCSDMDTVLVHVYPAAVADAGADVSVCAGESVSLNASGGVMYHWTPAFFLDDNDIPNPLCTPAVDITYTVTVTDVHGCTDNDAVFVDVLPANFLSVTDPVSVCTGGSVTLNASGGLTYSWSPGTYLDDATSATPICTPLTNITYIVTAENASGCSDIDTVHVIVNEVAFLTADDDIATCAGTSVMLHASGGVSYSWSPSTYLDDATSATPVCTPLTDIVYIVTAYNASGCLDTITVHVYVSPGDFAVSDALVNTCYATSVTLHSSGGTAYSWSPVTFLDDPTSATPICTPTSDITYYVSVSGAGGCIDVDTVVVQVAPALVINAGPDTTVCYGGQFKLHAEGGVEYLWTPSTFLDAPVLADPTCSPYFDITYIVYVTDASGCVGTDTVVIIVHAPPDIIASDDLTICRGDTVLLSASGGISYTWTPDPLEPCVGCASVEVSPLATTTYTVVGTDINGCVNSDEVIVTVDICNGIADIIPGGIQIYPNPAADILHIVLSGSPENIITLHLQNIFGERINANRTLHQSQEIYIGELSAGMYFLVLETDGKQYVIPFVKN